MTLPFVIRMARWALFVVILSATITGAIIIYDDGDLQPDPPAELQFAEVSEEWGIDYDITGEATGSAYGGVVVGDINRNGRADLLAIGGEDPVLYENVGDRFEANDRLPAMSYPPLKSALFFDATGNGWEDLLLIPKTGEPIYLENREGTFEAVEGGIDDRLQWGTGAAAADFTGDGRLDVVIVQNGNWTTTNPQRGTTGEATDGYENLLYRNTGGEFERVDAPNVSGSHWSLAISATDLTGDGRADIHVANDYGYDVILENQGEMSFDRKRIDNTNLHGMSSTIRDVNFDGHPDIFVTNIGFESPEKIWALDSGLDVRNVGNNLLINDGSGEFEDRADEYDVRRGGWGWAAAIEDFGNRGALDIVHATTSYLERQIDGSYAPVITPPSLWRQNGDSFESVDAEEAGFEPANGRGLATLDFNGDGHLDIVIADTSGSILLYENQIDRGHWVSIDFRNRDAQAQGSTITVTDGTREQVRTVDSRTDFFSQSTRLLHFGVDAAETVTVTIERPDGTEVTVDDVAVDQRLVVEPDGSITQSHQSS